MELNKRKSLLTPAAPTVWGMIHGDINNQQDIVDKISEKAEEAVTDELTHRVMSEVLAVINPMLGEVVEQTQPKLESGVNIKTLKGRSIMGEGDLDPLDEGDRMLLETIDTKADKSTTYTKTQVDNLIDNVEIDTSNLATKQDVQDLRDSDVQRALMKSDYAQNVAMNANTQVSELRTYVDEQIGGINTITEDILA